jgi:hypothetical protein
MYTKISSENRREEIVWDAAVRLKNIVKTEHK